jgi:hypothetical protein
MLLIFARNSVLSGCMGFVSGGLGIGIDAGIDTSTFATVSTLATTADSTDSVVALTVDFLP